MHPPILPPWKEDLFLPDVIDFNMTNNPDQPFYRYVAADESVKIITHLEFGRAAHRVAHNLRPNRSGIDGEVVGILVQTDTVVYNAIIAGLIVAGLVPFPISPRNTTAIVSDLLVRTSCHRLITNNSTLMDSLVDHEVHIEKLPSLRTVFPRLAHEVADHPFERYPDPGNRPSASDTCTILHSSGSTGIPKAVAQTHLYWMQVAYCEFRDHVPRLILGSMSLPGFHAAGLISHLFLCAYDLVTSAVFPPTSATSGGLPPVPSPETVLKYAMLTKCNGIFVIPAFIQAWVTMPDALDYLKSLELLSYAGGPLPPKVGEYLVAAGVRLHPIYGGTEFGAPTPRLPTKGDENEWEFLRFYKHVNVRWVPQGDGTFECQFLTCKAHRPVILNLPDAEGYATGDIFQPHPTKEHLWKIIGRLDDVIIHASGEKTVPGPMEVIIMSNPLIKSATVFGRARNQTGVLIELQGETEMDTRDPVQLAKLRNQIWPSVEEANKEVPAFSRIFKEMLLFAVNDKPLPRSIKGSILRKASLELYEAEIEALYNNIELNVATEHSGPASWSLADIETWIQGQATEIASRVHLSPHVNLFEHGFDSLSASLLRLRIMNAMRSSGNPTFDALSQKINQNLVYDLPTVKEIAVYITSLSQASEGSQSFQRARTSAIEALIMKFSGHPITLSSSIPPSAEHSGIVVFLTGSTGQLGSQILERLLQNDQISKVYAFNRHNQDNFTLMNRHKMRFKDIGIDLGLLQSSKLILIEGDSTQHDLGLDRKLYNEILLSVDVLIHNAWPLDFNFPLISYESAIQSSQNLINFVKESQNAPHIRFLFISSVASAQSWDDSHGPVPETIIEDACFAIGGGYGEGKYVVERILASSGLHATSLRFGQICGAPPKGSWPITEWLPMLVRSSISLKLIPDIEGGVAWLPGDLAATAVVDLASVPLTTSFPDALNVVYPHPMDHKAILNGIVMGIKELMNLELKVVPFDEWVSALESFAEKATTESLKKIPAIKILSFLHQYAASKSSPRLYLQQKLQDITLTMDADHIRKINDKDAKLWVKYWYQLGYLT